MSFRVEALEFFLKQIKKIDEKSKRIIQEKIALIKENPFRFKRIHSKKFHKVFRVRLNLQGKETRLIYIVLEPNILIVCLLERKKNYRDLEKYLSKI
ncbi:MAG: hypothetical protein ABIE23_06000 [archaeon]